MGRACRVWQFRECFATAVIVCAGPPTTSLYTSGCGRAGRGSDSAGTCGSGLQPRHVAMPNKWCTGNQLRVRAETRTHTFLTRSACPPRTSVSESEDLCITMWSPTPGALCVQRPQLLQFHLRLTEYISALIKLAASGLFRHRRPVRPGTGRRGSPPSNYPDRFPMALRPETRRGRRALWLTGPNKDSFLFLSQ